MTIGPSLLQRHAFALVLLLAACTPAPPASQPAADPPAPQSAPNPADTSATTAPTTEPPLSWADVARDPQAIGHWRANADETRAAFGSDPPAFTIGCARGFLQIERSFSRPHGVALGQSTPFNILLPRETIMYSALPAADRAPRLWLAAPRGDLRLDALAASEEEFAIRYSRVLANCHGGSHYE